jgi:hypothetical protein
VSQINNFSQEYSQHFNQSESENMIDREANFNKPGNFDDRLQEVKRRIASLSIKAGNTYGQPLGLDTPDNFAA